MRMNDAAFWMADDAFQDSCLAATKASLREFAPRHRCIAHCPWPICAGDRVSCDTARHHLPHPSHLVREWNLDETARLLVVLPNMPLATQHLYDEGWKIAVGIGVASACRPR